MYIADSKYEVAIDRWQQTAANNLLSLLFQLLHHCCHGKHQLGAHQNLFIFPEKMVIIWLVGSIWQGIIKLCTIVYNLGPHEYLARISQIVIFQKRFSQVYHFTCL